MIHARFIVRRAVPADIPALVVLMREFYAEAQYPLDESWAERSFTALLDNVTLGGAWLALHENEPAGHAVLSVRHAMEFGGLAAYVDDLYVRPQYRRRGLAAHLLDALLAECRRQNCKVVQVEVGDTNAAARATYAKLGMVPLTDGRLLMRRVLT